MATYTSNYGWTKPSGSDNVDISVLNDNLDDQDSTIHDAFLNMAPPFSESSTYAVDDIVLYGTKLYKCHTAVVTPGSWTGSTNWQVYKLSEGGSGGGGTSDYSALNNKPKINGVELAGNMTTGDLNIDYNDLKNKPIIPSAQIQSDWDQSDNTKADYIKNKPTLGTAAAKNVPSAGNASLTEVVLGSDSRLSDDRNAKDVYSWAKAATKPTYTATEVGAIPSTDKGANDGVAELDSNGKVPSSQLPSYVDDVLSYASQNAFPATGETGKIYIAEDTNKTYRWSGSAYAEISASLALGETSSTAYRGDRGKTAYDHSQSTGNPHGTTASDVGLGNVPNVSTNDQKPTFTKASTRNNIASGEKLSVILGKVQKFFNDLKTVAFSGSYTDLSNKPSIPTKTSDLTNDSNFVSDANYVHTDNNFTASEKTKLAGIASGAEANVQANWSQTNTSADDFIKNKPSLATVATSGSYNDLSNKPTIPAAQVNSDWNASSGVAEILNKPSSYTPSSHKHGNIQNGGTLQTTDVAIANGDKLVVTDSSNSAKIARTSVAFDGTTTTQALSKKGTFETFSKFSGSYIDLTNKPQINSVELSGNKTTGDLGLQDKMQYSTMPTASADNEGKIYQYVGTTDANYTNGYYYKCVENSGSYSWQLEENIKEQTPTFSQASTRSNIASGEKLSVIMGKIQKFFNDLKSVAFSGSYTDLSDKPTIPTSASGISYDNTNSGLSATKVQGAVDELANFKMVILTNTTYLYSNGAAVKHGYTVTLTFSGFKGLTSHAITTLSGLVPQGMRPQTTVKCPIISPSASGITASEVYRIMVRSTGDIDIYPYNGVATQNNLEFSLTYVV